MQTYGFVFARGGSKGVPRKNVRDLCGRPLITYAIELGQEMAEIDRVFVSTDDPEIAEISRQWGAEVIDRPAQLAGDESSEWDAWRHALEWVEGRYGGFDIFVSLPTTAPLRHRGDVAKCIARLTDKSDLVCTVTPASHSPYFNMVEFTPQDRIRLLCDVGGVGRRQDAPKAYNMTTVAYVARPAFIRQASGLWEGRVSAVEVPPERAIDIDTEIDFRLAELLMKERIRDD